mmetsp:Transcript_49083/g.136414  ORF Transcript_49083/g.136414 Transcript_49083/m.136414 type:complete len:243 (+) Transcript_49083:197-925(+)
MGPTPTTLSAGDWTRARRRTPQPYSRRRSWTTARWWGASASAASSSSSRTSGGRTATAAPTSRTSAASPRGAGRTRTRSSTRSGGGCWTCTAGPGRPTTSTRASSPPVRNRPPPWGPQTRAQSAAVARPGGARSYRRPASPRRTAPLPWHATPARGSHQPRPQGRGGAWPWDWCDALRCWCRASLGRHSLPWSSEPRGRDWLTDTPMVSVLAEQVLPVWQCRGPRRNEVPLLNSSYHLRAVP